MCLNSLKSNDQQSDNSSNNIHTAILKSLLHVLPTQTTNSDIEVEVLRLISWARFDESTSESKVRLSEST